MRRLLPLDRMALPPPRRALYRSGGLDMRRDAGRSPAATVLRAKVVLPQSGVLDSKASKA